MLVVPLGFVLQEALLSKSNEIGIFNTDDEQIL